jgi:hypothetical protein
MVEKTYKLKRYSGRMTQRSLYVDADVWDRVKVQAATLGKSVNELINEFLWNLAYSDELRKLEYDYQGLKKDFIRLVRETRHIVATLKELGVYDQITGLAFKLGLKEDLSNIGEIIPKLTLEWTDQDSLIVFIDLLETSKRKRDSRRRHHPRSREEVFISWRARGCRPIARGRSTFRSRSWKRVRSAGAES